MGYPRPTSVKWDGGKDNPTHFGGVTITRRLDDGKEYAWHIPYDGVVTLQQVADIFDVSSVTVNKWVSDHMLQTIKHKGLPALTTMWEVKRLWRARGGRGRQDRAAPEE